MNRHGRLAWIGVLLLLAGTTGCGDAVSPPAVGAQATSPASQFQPTAAGVVRGRVTWQGEPPVAEPIEVHVNLLGNAVFQKHHFRPNPNAPAVDSSSNGMQDVVVFLRGVDASKARPWDHPPVRVEQRDCRFQLRQGDADSRCGFVRRGSVIQMISQDDVYHSLHAGGAAFFTLAFPDRDRPLERRLSENGVVELTSAAGYSWMRAYLFVDDHPYYARTDKEGRFELRDVPPGRYEIVCWVPNWIKERHERDPESGHVTRISFKPPLEQVQVTALEARETKDILFRVEH